MHHALIRRARVALVGLAAATALAAPAFLTPLATPAAAVTYTSKPSISSQPVSVKAVVAQHIQFTVKASRAASYQWQRQAPGSKAWADVKGATRSTYATLTARKDSGTHVRVKVANPKGTAYSSSVSLTIWGYDAKNAVSHGAIWESGDWVGLIDSTDTDAGPELKKADSHNKPAKAGYTYVSSLVVVANIGSAPATPYESVGVGFVGKSGKFYGECENAFFRQDWIDTAETDPGDADGGQFCAMVRTSDIAGGTWVTLGDFQSGKDNKNVIFVKQS